MSDESPIIVPVGVEKPAPPKVEEPVEPDWTETEFPINIFDNKLVIKRADVSEMTEGGLYIPESARRGEFKTMTGTVIAAGPGIMKGDGTYCPMRAKVGDVVVFEKFRSMIPITVQSFNYHILAETDLIGTVANGGSVKVR
jgi:chaperonin GroES